MPKQTNKDDIKEKLDYIGLDLDNIPATMKFLEPIDFRITKTYDTNKHKQYKFVPVKEIELLLSPTNRLDELEEKYAKASPVYSYLVPDDEKNITKHATFLNMLKTVDIDKIEQIEEEQKELNKKIPFKIKYQGNYLWQIYYSENNDRYFMLVPTEDEDYSAFFYILKKQLAKKKTGKIFVPISNAEYSSRYFKKSEFEDLENYLWLFTKDWPMIYEVFDKNDELSIHVVGEAEVYGSVKTPYKVKLSDKVEASKFYKLLKALFILQTELPHYYKFDTNIDKQGSLEFFYNDKQLQWEGITDFIKEECIELDELYQKADEEIVELQTKLEDLKTIAVELEIEYLAKEKQISTFLECKKSFFGKVKYFFKYNKKPNKKGIRQKIEKANGQSKKVERHKEKKKEIQKDYDDGNYQTIEELIERGNKYYAKEKEIKNILMDINALKLRNKNMTKKIENASAFIEEIDSHKRSIFEFWKYSNKDEVASLAEGEQEEVNIKKKINKTFDYKEDMEELGVQMDTQQRNVLSKEELESVFITTTSVIDLLNKLKTNSILPKDIENALKSIKEEAKKEKALFEKEEFDVFGARSQDTTKLRTIANKKHREIPRDKYRILEIGKGTRQLGYKMTLENILTNVNSALEKVKLTEELPVYKAMCDAKLQQNELNVFNLNLEEEVNNVINSDGQKINLYKINLLRNTNAILYSNIVFYDNVNKTLPVGMDLSSKVLFDTSSNKIKLNSKRVFRIVTMPDPNDLSKIVLKTVNVFEYVVEEKLEEQDEDFAENVEQDSEVEDVEDIDTADDEDIEAVDVAEDVDVEEYDVDVDDEGENEDEVLEEKPKRKKLGISLSRLKHKSSYDEDDDDEDYDDDDDDDYDDDDD